MSQEKKNEPLEVKINNNYTVLHCSFLVNYFVNNNNQICYHEGGEFNPVNVMRLRWYIQGYVKALDEFGITCDMNEKYSEPDIGLIPIIFKKDIGALEKGLKILNIGQIFAKDIKSMSIEEYNKFILLNKEY